ncbi:MAG: hypothetical protein Q7S88_02350 [Candidatus Daviesbacteria bacterium]|nr:hypothetical protein [Candidatus Daviesbacteria bacterium]
MIENPDSYIIRKALSQTGYQPFDIARATQAVQKVITPTQEEELELIRSNSSRVHNRLDEVVDRLGVRKSYLGPATLSAFYATDAAVDAFRSNAIRARQDQQPALFILFFDTDFGATMGIHPIIAITKPESAKSIPDLSTVIADTTEESEHFLGKVISITDQASIFLKIQSEKNRWSVLFDETTSKNPKGFILVDELNKQLKGLPNRLEQYNLSEMLVPEFVAAGADFSRAIFRAIYPVSERFISK